MTLWAVLLYYHDQNNEQQFCKIIHILPYSKVPKRLKIPPGPHVFFEWDQMKFLHWVWLCLFLEIQTLRSQAQLQQIIRSRWPSCKFELVSYPRYTV